MFKLTVIGAVLVAATSAAVFQDKMALKNLQAREPSFLMNSNITDPREYINEWAEYIEDELEEQAEVLTEEAYAQKDVLVRELMQCYDVNGDGALNTTEFDRYVVDSIIGRKGRCPSYVPPTAAQLTTTQLNTLRSWTNATSLTRVFASTSGNFSKSDLLDDIRGLNNTIFIGETDNGTLFGGYFSQ